MTNSLRKKIQDVKKKHNILEGKNRIRGINSVDGSATERKDKRSCQFEDRTTEVTQSEQQRENRLEKSEQSLRGCGTVTEDAVFVSSEV